MPLYAKANPFFSSANWDPVVSGAAAGGFSSSHYPSMAMDNPGMSCFPHYQPGSGSGYAPDMPSSLLPFGDCGGGQIGHFLASDKKGESVGRLIRAGESHEDHHQVSDDGVLGVSPTGKRRQPEAESQWNKKAVEEFQEDPQRGSDQSQKKHKNGQSKETMNKESSQSEEAPKENYIHLLQSRDRNTPTLGLNPFTGFQGTIPNLSTTTNPQFNPLPQTTLESELQNLYQMGFVSNPSTMSSFLPNGRLKPEL